MRQDTRELCEKMDDAIDLVQENKLDEAQLLLVEIAKLLTAWVERNLTP